MNKMRGLGLQRWHIVAVVVVGLLALNGWAWVSRHNSATPQQEMRALVGTVGESYLLPTDEEPTLGTVTDSKKLSKQPFFAKAASGDKVLLYSRNHLAVLYRPSIHKIITVGPINGEVAYNKFSVAMRNGTTDSSLFDKATRATLASFPNASIIEKSAAKRTNYPHTVVIPTTDGKKDLAAQVAAGIGAQVGVMPIGEDTPATDVLIIIGSDYGKAAAQTQTSTSNKATQ